MTMAGEAWAKPSDLSADLSSIQPLKNNNYEVRYDQNGKSLAGLVIKNNYWICYDQNSAGNTIDFFMKIERLSFQQAMSIITTHTDYDASERNLLQKTVIARL